MNGGTNGCFFSHSKEAKVSNLKYLTMALIASDVMLNHLPPLHDQKHIRSSACRHHRHHGALPTVSYIGGTSSGARAPELWCPPIFFGVFLMVYSHLCWQCSNKNRKCREHINTLGKKDKLIFLKPIFEIKTKNLLSTWKGTRVLVPGHLNSGAPTFFQCFLGCVSSFVGAPESCCRKKEGEEEEVDGNNLLLFS